ncbi:LysR family transcriptional regulator [Vibrio fluvialis]|uniref:LysR family transcriptional regulator n=1 Tax=Vibrio fluvialis TaxID=676 RepID=UPI0005CB59C0|nr:LysR family transcriptional regulator [Vibrio fluvialis]
MIITTERLRYLVAVVEHGNFSAAAKQLGVSTTAVNKAISALEFDLESEVFERHAGKRPVLNQLGKDLYFQALDVLPRLMKMEKQAEMIRLGIDTKLSIAVHPYSFYPKYTELFTRLLQKFPDVELNLVDAETLSLDTISCDILLGPTRNDLIRGFQSAGIDRLTWRVACAPHHPLSKLKGVIEYEDFAQYHQLLLCTGFLTKPEYREAMRYTTQVINVDRFYQYKELLLSGAGFALYPEVLLAPLEEQGLLVDLQFDYGKEDNHWLIELAWRPGLGAAGNWLIERILEE